MLNSFQSPGEVAFYIFDMPVYFYGIIMAIAVFVGFCVTNYLYKKLIQISVVSPSGERAGERGYNIKIPPSAAQTPPFNKGGFSNNLILDISPYLIISGIIGARLYYCLVNYSYYIQNPLEIFFIRQGGLSIHGAIIAGALALFYFSKRYKIPFLCLTDIFLCGTILAQSIGRWGNFFNSEAFGLPCDLPWKLYIPISHRPLEYINFEYFHPTFLYESLLDLGIFVVLTVAARQLGSEAAKLEGQRSGGQEGKPVNAARQLGSEAAKFEEQRAGGQDGKLVNKNGLNEISQFTKSDTDLFAYSPIRLFADKISLGETPQFPQPYGIITSLYLILYAIARILVEHFRIDSALNISGIPIAQIISFVMIIMGTFLLYKISVKKRPN